VPKTSYRYILVRPIHEYTLFVTLILVSRSRQQRITGDYRSTSSVTSMCANLIQDVVQQKPLCGLKLTTRAPASLLRLPQQMPAPEEDTSLTYEHYQPTARLFSTRCMHHAVNFTHTEAVYCISCRSIPHNRSPRHSVIDSLNVGFV